MPNLQSDHKIKNNRSYPEGCGKSREIIVTRHSLATPETHVCSGRESKLTLSSSAEGREGPLQQADKSPKLAYRFAFIQSEI